MAAKAPRCTLVDSQRSKRGSNAREGKNNAHVGQGLATDKFWLAEGLASIAAIPLGSMRCNAARNTGARPQGLHQELAPPSTAAPAPARTPPNAWVYCRRSLQFCRASKPPQRSPQWLLAAYTRCSACKIPCRWMRYRCQARHYHSTALMTLEHHEMRYDLSETYGRWTSQGRVNYANKSHAAAATVLSCSRVTGVAYQVIEQYNIQQTTITLELLSSNWYRQESLNNTHHPSLIHHTGPDCLFRTCSLFHLPCVRLSMGNYTARTAM